MEDWILGLLGLSSNPIKDIVSSVEQRILSVWTTATGFWSRVGAQWTGFRNAVGGWVSAQVAHAAALGTLLRWLLFTFIPRKIGDAVGALQKYSVTLIQNAIAAARAELITVRDWLHGLVDAAVARLDCWAAWVLARIGEIRGDLNRLLDHVFGVLGSPDRLVSWILTPLVNALIQWVKDNAVRLGRILVAQRLQIFMASLQWFEDVIARIL